MNAKLGLRTLQFFFFTSFVLLQCMQKIGVLADDEVFNEPLLGLIDHTKVFEIRCRPNNMLSSYLHQYPLFFLLLLILHQQQQLLMFIDKGL